jgi:HNH endonuclease
MGKRIAFTDDQIVGMVKAYTEGERLDSIAGRFGCSVSTLCNRVIKPAGLVEPGRKRSRYSHAEKDEMARRYDEGESLGSLARAFGCTVPNVRYLVRNRGVQVRAPGKSQVSEATLGLIRERRAAGVSHQVIATELGVKKHTILVWCRKIGLPADRASGSAHPSWKGGRIVDRSGYVRVKIDPQDPMAGMADQNGYVLEHRLAVSRVLGRPLTETETVHHRNGIHGDNDLSNLQLRQGRHGKGVVAQCLDCGSHRIGFDEL